MSDTNTAIVNYLTDVTLNNSTITVLFPRLPMPQP
jgi:hypothetical protein